VNSEVRGFLSRAFFYVLKMLIHLQISKNSRTFAVGETGASSENSGTHVHY
jgi:hypothetical protein